MPEFIQVRNVSSDLFDLQYDGQRVKADADGFFTTNIGKVSLKVKEGIQKHDFLARRFDFREPLQVTITRDWGSGTDTLVQQVNIEDFDDDGHIDLEKLLSGQPAEHELQSISIDLAPKINLSSKPMTHVNSDSPYSDDWTALLTPPTGQEQASPTKELEILPMNETEAFEVTRNFDDKGWSDNLEVYVPDFEAAASSVLEKAIQENKLNARMRAVDPRNQNGAFFDGYGISSDSSSSEEQCLTAKARQLLYTALLDLFPENVKTYLLDDPNNRSKLDEVFEFNQIRFLSPDNLEPHNRGWHIDFDGLNLVMKLGRNKPGELGTLYDNRFNNVKPPNPGQPTDEIEGLGLPFIDRDHIMTAQNLNDDELRQAGLNGSPTIHTGQRLNQALGVRNSVHAGPKARHFITDTGTDRRWIMTCELSPKEKIDQKNLCFMARLKMSRLAKLVLTSHAAALLSERLFDKDHPQYIRDDQLSAALFDEIKPSVSPNKHAELLERYSTYQFEYSNDPSLGSSPFDIIQADLDRANGSAESTSEPKTTKKNRKGIRRFISKSFRPFRRNTYAP